MNVWKKVIALIASAMVLIRFLTVQSFALAAAPVVAGEELSETLITILIASGHSQSELDGLSVTELQSLADQDLKADKINNKTLVHDNVTGLDIPLSTWFLLYGNPVGLVEQAVANFVVENKEALIGDDYFWEPTPTVDLNGSGALMLRYNNDGTLYEAYYCDYVVWNDNLGRYYFYGDSIQYLRYGRNGNVEYSQIVPTGFSIGQIENCKYYGDVRTIEGEECPTDDTYEYVLGEADGKKVTLDMLNPDGTVTIDGVTYYPADYLDPDKLTEEGKNKLIYNITNAITNTYVISDDKPIVDDEDITVEVAEELEDFTVSPSIITVFPFCLPFDFVRGMKLFSAEPVTPHFEITIDVPAVLNIPAQEWTLEIDLEKFEPLAKITRWTSLIGFSYLLISLSTKIVKGAGA